MDSIKNRVQIGVVGDGNCSGNAAGLAYHTGRLIAENGAVLVTGGLLGVMENASRGAKEAGGLVVGILPGFDISDANSYVDIAIPTGLSHARNALVVRASRVVIAVEGSYGTLSEIALALKMGIPVIGINTWDISPDIIKTSTPEEAVEKAMALIKQVKEAGKTGT